MEEKYEEPLDWSKPEKPFACPYCGGEGYTALLWECCDESRADFEALMTNYVPLEPTIVVSSRIAKLLKKLFNIGDVNET